MKVTLNHVVLSGISDGSRQRDLNVLAALDREMKHRGHQLDVLLAANIDLDLEHLIRGLAQNATVLKTDILASPTYRRIVGTHLRLNRFLSKGSADVLHHSYYPAPAVSCQLAVTVNDLRFVLFPETYSRSRRIFLGQVVPAAIKRADVVFSISEWTKNEIVSTYKVQPERIRVVPIACNPAFRREENGERLEVVRKAYGLPERFLLCVGHLEPRKNYERIIDAFCRLDQERWRDVGLVIVGRNSLRWRKILKYADGRGRLGKIKFTGYVTDDHLPAIYSLAVALVFTSVHEGFGIPLLEAMACGLPVVASSTTAMPEVVGNAGVLVNPLSVVDIAAGIDAVLSSRQLRQDLSRKGMRRIHRFSAATAARELVNGYESIGQ